VDIIAIMKRAIKTILLVAVLMVGLGGGNTPREPADAPDQVAVRTTAPAAAVPSKPEAVLEAGVSLIVLPRRELVEELLPVPAGLEDKIRFWEMVYSEYDYSDVIICHGGHPDIVYGVVEANAGREGRLIKQVRERLLAIDEIIKTSDDPVGEILKRPDAFDLLEIYHKLDGVEGDDRFARAADKGAIRGVRGHRSDLKSAFRRAAPYLPAMEREFEARGVPPILTRLVFVESMFDRDARSKKDAYGVWQFMPGTAKQYLKINHLVDERRDPVAASRAAAKMLSRSYEKLGSWPLAVTAYNAGPNRMRRAVKKTGETSLLAVLDKSKHQAFGYCVRNFYARLLGVVRAEIELGINPETEQIHFDPENYAVTNLPASFKVSEISTALGIKQRLLVSFNSDWTRAVELGLNPLPKGFKLKLPPSADTNAPTALQSFARARHEKQNQKEKDKLAITP